MILHISIEVVARTQSSPTTSHKYLHAISSEKRMSSNTVNQCGQDPDPGYSGVNRFALWSWRGRVAQSRRRRRSWRRNLCKVSRVLLFYKEEGSLYTLAQSGVRCISSWYINCGSPHQYQGKTDQRCRRQEKTEASQDDRPA